MNNNSFFHYKWVDFSPPSSWAEGNLRERKAKLKRQGVYSSSRKLPNSTGWLKPGRLQWRTHISWPLLCLQRVVSNVCISNGWNPKPKLFINRLKMSSSTWKEHLNSLRKRTELNHTLQITGRIATVRKMRRGLRKYLSPPNNVYSHTTIYEGVTNPDGSHMYLKLGGHLTFRVHRSGNKGAFQSRARVQRHTAALVE